jgi:uncharacterized protein (TIGR02145 family)
MKKTILFSILFAFATIALNAQTIYYVKPDGTSDGKSWVTAGNLESIVGALHATPVQNVQIWVQKGTYYPSTMLTIPNFLKLYGGFSGTETSLEQRDLSTNSTIIDAQNKFGSIIRMGASCELNGFVIQNGYAHGNPQKNGGGIWADDNCIIANCVIINNSAYANGGGLFAKGPMDIINSTIKDNTAKGNGGNMFGHCITLHAGDGLSDGVDEVAPSNPPITSVEPELEPEPVLPMTGCNSNALTFTLGTPKFASSQTWKVGIQEWSDAVTAPGCAKGNSTGNNAYANDATVADCRQAINGFKGHYFSWCMVMRYAEQLCPGDWRVPTKDDFIALDLALGGNGTNGQVVSARPTAYMPTTGSGTAAQQGGIWGGSRFTADASRLPNGGARYWSSTERNGTSAYSLYFSASSISPQFNYNKYYGFALRCVRDN